MLKKSAGILVYKIENNVIKVLLGHMGGPYWKNIDSGAWSIPKGEFKNELAINAGIREFKEETGLTITKENLKYLKSKKVSRRKLLVIFYVEKDFFLTNTVSNTFKLEWPKGSGIIEKFPEIDKVEWIELNVAKEKILRNQIYFLDKIEEVINNSIFTKNNFK